MSSGYVVVIGAANIDIAGIATGALMPGDSNIGSIRLTHGGVGRNIAHNLALLGCKTQLIAPFGEDSLGDELARSCLEVGICLEHSFTVPDKRSSSYLYIADAHGDMQLAINDMAIIDELTVEVLGQRLDLINGAEACVIDANLTAEVLTWIASHVRVPLFSDPISCVKAPRLSPILGKLHSFKPNRMEAEALTSCLDIDEAADMLLSTGLQQVFISLGKEGLLCADKNQHIQLARPPAHAAIVNTTGAGDAMMAAIVWAHLQGLNLEKSGRAGLAAAEICLESTNTVNPAMSAELVHQRMEEQRWN